MQVRKLAAWAAMGALVLAAAAAHGQEITGGISGTVTENGKPAAGATVTVTNAATGVSTTTTSGPDGFYTVRNLPPGGPYKVSVTATDKTASTEQVDQVPIGAPYDLDIALGGGAVSEVTVTAAPTVRNATIATGPRTTFSAKDIATLPSFARDLHDLVRLNPFVTVDEANSNALIIAGENNHFNTIYLDGVRQSDDFGLNNDGYPTQRSPFSLTIIQSLNIEIAPYDVQYGDFEGGILNIVTKSGTNQFHGSVDYEYDSNFDSGKTIGVQDNSVLGDTKQETVTTRFRDEDSSITLGGPIWPDHLFFFFGYDKYQSLGSSTYVPSDVAGTNIVTGVTSAEATTTQTILSTSLGTAIPNLATLVPGATSGTGYGYNPLGYGGSAPELNTDYFGKIDWYITDKQHLWFSYQQTDGNQYNTPDASISGKGELNLASSDYVYAQDLDAYVVDLTSNWTDDLATEAEVTYRDVESPTQLLAGPFSNFLIKIPTEGEIDLGPDQSRQANNLGVKDWQAQLRAHYTIGDNVITAGYAWEQLTEFDLFVQEADGDYTFSNTCGPGKGLPDGEFINLADHIACNLTYQNTVDNNPLAAATSAVDYTNTVYAEDEWHVSPELTVTGGLRFEAYSSPSRPLADPRFQAQYGFSNTGTINGENVLMPRAGFNWKPDPTLTVTGGFGLFSGGNPGVYTYNSFDTTGNLLGLVSYSCTAVNCGQSGTAGVQSSALTSSGATKGTPALIDVTGSSIPTAIQTDVTTSANYGTGNTNSVDPHFQPPSVWKGSLSVVKTVDFSDMSGRFAAMKWLGDNWRLHGDLLLTKTQNGVEWVDLFEEQNQLNATTAAALGIASPDGLAPDGRPLFNPDRYSQIVPLTGVNGVPAEIRPAGGYDIELTDTHKGDSMLWAIGVGKRLPWGLDVDYTFTSQHVQDVTGATSSVASSNYKDNMFADPNNLSLSTSNYQILWEHRLSFDFEHNFISDLKTAFRVFAYERAGLPFSYVFCTTASSTCATGASGNGVAEANGAPVEELFGQFETGVSNQLLYVPKTVNGQVTATSDPAVTYGPGFNVAQFNAFLQSSGLIKYAGEIAPRNGFHSNAYGTGDIQISQELPAFFPHDAKGEIYLDIINFPNLLNKSWGIDNEVGFPYEYAPVVAYNCQWSGQTFNAGTANAVTMPACAAGKGNFYQYNVFRPPASNNATTIQTPAFPPVSTWVLKFGIRYKF